MRGRHNFVSRILEKNKHTQSEHSKTFLTNNLFRFSVFVFLTIFVLITDSMSKVHYIPRLINLRVPCNPRLHLPLDEDANL